MALKIMRIFCLFFMLANVYGNIVKDGNFEVNSWSIAEWPKNKGSFEMDAVVFHSGKASLKITNINNDERTLVQQGVKLKPNTEYKLSFYIKGAEIVSGKSGKGGGGFMVLNKGSYLAEGGPDGRWTLSAGTFDWRKCEAVFNSGSAENVKLYMALVDATGSVWFDDVVLEEVSKRSMASDPVSASIFPVDFQKGVFNVIEDFPCVMLFSFKGEQSKLKNPILILEVPDSFVCAGASPWYPVEISQFWKWGVEKMGETRVKRDGQDYIRYSIELNKVILRRLNPDSYAWNNYERIYIKSVPGSNGKHGTAYWKLTDGNWKGKEQHFEINSVGPIVFPKAKLEKFGLMVGYLNNVSAPLGEVKDGYMGYWKSLSKKLFTYDFFGWNSTDESIRKVITDNFNVTVFIASTRGTPILGLEKWIKENKLTIPLCILSGNVVNKNAVCPEYLAKDPGALIWNDYVPSGIKEKMKYIPDAEFIELDFEPGAMDHCFCEACRKRFSEEFAGEGKVLTEDEIKKKYSVKWFEFRIRQHAEILANYSACVKKYFPKAKAVLVTDPLHSSGKEVQQWCGVDIRLSDNGEFALFRNMPYYSGVSFFNDIEFNNKVLKTPNFNLIDPAENMEMFYKRYTPEGVKMNILASAALGCKGIGFWPSDSLDGRYLQEIVAACKLVAAGENYYFSGEAVKNISVEPRNVFGKTILDDGDEVVLTFPDFSNTLKSVCHLKDGNYLITLFNYDSENDVVANIKIPGIGNEKYEITDHKDGSKYVAEIGNGFLAEIKKTDVKVLEAKPLKDSSLASGSGPQETLAEKVRKFKDSFQATDKFPVIKEGKAGMSWGVLKPERVPMMKIVNGEGVAYIDTKCATVAGWSKYNDRFSDALLHNKMRGELDKLVMYSGFSGEMVFSFEKGYVKDGSPFVEFVFKVPPPENADPNMSSSEGLLIRKTISLEDNGRSLRFHMRLTNENPFKKDIKTGFRIKNYPMLGSALAGSKALSQISGIIFETPAGKGKISSGAPQNNLFLKEDGKTISSLGAGVTSKAWTCSDICVEVSDGVHTKRMIFTPDKENTAGFYSWWSEISGFTVEFLTKEPVLKYGESFDYEYTVKLEE